jgi:NADPH-dependent ferric siderophore reductase
MLGTVIEVRGVTMTTPSVRGAAGRRGHRPPPRQVEVVGVERLTPRLTAIQFSGPGLVGFPTPPPTAHIKVFLPDENGALALPQAGPDGLVMPAGKRPTMRTYTPRRYDPATNTLEVQFVLHGEGPASTWAQRAAVGDQVAIAGPGGRFALDATVPHWWIGADESAIPAVATLLEALPDTATAEVHLEVAGAQDELPLPAPAGATVTWHHRRVADAWGAELAAAARSATPPAGTHAWVACESGAVRGLRSYFLTERQWPRTALTSRGYWRLGAADHPDHDYGED